MIVPPLRVIDLILTSACNLRCAYCYQDTHPGRRLDWPTLRSALDRALKSPADLMTVNFQGGEPLLEKEALRRAVSYLEERRGSQKTFRYGITTNGTRLDEGDLEFFDRYGFSVRLSFDGPQPVQDYRAPGTFARLDRLLDRARLRHPDMWRHRWRVQAVFTTATLPHLSETVRYFLDKEVTELRIYPSIVADPGWSEGSFREMRRQFLRIYRASRKHRRRTGRIAVEFLRGGQANFDASSSGSAVANAGRSLPDVTSEKTAAVVRSSAAVIDRAMCGVGAGRTLTVDVDGETYGCPTFIHSCQSHSVSPLAGRIGGLGLGRIDAADLDERRAGQPGPLIATGLFHSRRTRYSSFGRCENCRFLDGCMICPVAIARIPGNSDPDRIPDHMCAFNQIVLALRRRFAPAGRQQAAEDGHLSGRENAAGTFPG